MIEVQAHDNIAVQYISHCAMETLTLLKIGLEIDLLSEDILCVLH